MANTMKGARLGMQIQMAPVKKHLLQCSRHPQRSQVASTVAVASLDATPFLTDFVKQPQRRTDTKEAKPFSELPGPKGLPLIGTALQYSPLGPYTVEHMSEARKDLFKKYGKIVKENVGPYTMVHLFDPTDVATVFHNEGRYPNRGMMVPLVQVLAKRMKEKKIMQPTIRKLLAIVCLIPAKPPYKEKFLTIKQFGDMKYDKHQMVTADLAQSQGKEWWDVRKRIQKRMMHPRSASTYIENQVLVATDFVHHIKKCLDDKSEVEDCKKELFKYVAEAMGTVAFNSRLNSFREKNEDAQALINASYQMMRCLNESLASLPLYMYLRTPLYKRAESSSLILRSIATKYMSHSFASLAEAEKNGRLDEEQNNFVLSLLAHKDLSFEDAVDFTVSFFSAGLDSTSSALTFLLFQLAKNPEKQQKLFEEIQHILQDKGTINKESLEAMNYLKACLKESFRLVYPVGGLARELEKDVVLGGYHIPKGTKLLCNNPIMCHMEEYFEEPDKYIPERWLRGNDKKHSHPDHAFLVLPFGHGPRNCIGRRFAEQQIYICIIKLLLHYSVEYHYEDIGKREDIFTAPDRPLRLTFCERKN